MDEPHLHFVHLTATMWGMKTPTPACVKWTAIINDWRNTGLSVPEFCEQRSIKRASFYLWRARFEDARRDGANCPPAFVEARVTAGAAGRGKPRRAGNSTAACEAGATASGISLELSRGVRVCVAPGFDPRVLADVVATLEEAS